MSGVGVVGDGGRVGKGCRRLKSGESLKEPPSGVGEILD